MLWQVQEWVELFTDFTKDVLALTASGKHRQAVIAYRLLLDLSKDPGENTDILGNHGAPEDAVPIDFSEVIGAYTRSLTVIAPEPAPETLGGRAVTISIEPGWKYSRRVGRRTVGGVSIDR